MINYIGKTLGNRYEVISQVGEGGMAVVCKAKCHVLNRMVAAKILKDEFVNDEEFMLKFKNEALAVGSLNQQNIISIYDVGEEEGVPYIIMEFVDGCNIKDIIHREGRLDKDRALNYSMQIAYALKEAHHNKIIHRDIKSQNIIITKKDVVKVADFGIAKAVTSSTITAVGTIMGSVHYFSPEQARGGYIDERSDIYSLGIVMYEMVTGKLPFDGDSPVNIALKHIQDEIHFEDNDSIPSEVKDIIRKATQKSPDRRYKKIEDLIEDIEYVRNSKAIALDMGFADETYRTQRISSDDEEYKIIFTDLAEKKESVSKGRSKHRKEKKSSVEDEPALTKKSMGVIIAGALLASIVAISGFFLLKSGFGNDTNTFETPNFVKMTIEEANEKAKEAALELVVAKGEINPNFDPGQIISQEPEAGTKIKTGTTIHLTVSEERKEEPIKVPKIEGKDIGEAKKILIEIGFNPLIEYKSDVEKENIVISQTPVEGYEMEKGSRVKIVVSSGLDESQVVVPEVIGKTVEDARSTFANAKLGTSVSYRENKNQPEGIVLSQIPKAGSKVSIDSEVSIVVNRFETPLLTSVPIVITLDQDRASVRVEVIDADTSEVVYNQDVNPVALGGTLAISVQGEPGHTKEYFVYLDGDRTTIYAKPRVEF